MSSLRPIIDSHIHLDKYENEEVDAIIQEVEKLITVSFDLTSCKQNLVLAEKFPQHVMPAFGLHPEQSLPNEQSLSDLLEWMETHQHQAVAVGEVGLPYYLRREQNNKNFPLSLYIDLLEQFILIAKRWNKPLILHAIYEDARLVCDLLEKHSMQKAHFHWFKGDEVTIERMIKNGYYISVTPDICYEVDIQQLTTLYPLEQLMVETDGPWPFESLFRGKRTSPNMIHHSVKKIARLKDTPISDVYQRLYENTKRFYEI